MPGQQARFLCEQLQAIQPSIRDLNSTSILLRTRSRRRPAGASTRSASPRLLQRGPVASYHLPRSLHPPAEQPANCVLECLTERPGPPFPDARQFLRRIRNHQHSDNPFPLFRVPDRKARNDTHRSYPSPWAGSSSRQFQHICRVQSCSDPHQGIAVRYRRK